MNYRQKLGYTALGAMIMLTGMTIDSILAPPSVAQRNGAFDEIQCSKLTVVNSLGTRAITLASHPIRGNQINLYDQTGTQRVGFLADADGTSMEISYPSAHSISLAAVKNGADLSVENAEGTLLINLGASHDSRHLNMNNPAGRQMISLYTLDEGSSNAIALNNSNGKDSVTLYSLARGIIKGINIYDHRGERVWQVP